MRILVVIIFFFVAMESVQADCISRPKIKQRWVEQPDKVIRITETKSHIRVYSAVGRSESEADKSARDKIAKKMGAELAEDCSIKRGEIGEVVNCSRKADIKYKILDEYIEECPDNYTVYLIAETATKSVDFSPTSIDLINDIGKTPLSHSLLPFVPFGGAQFYTRNYGTGTLFAIGEAALIAGVFIAEESRKDFKTKKKRASTTDDYNRYRDKQTESKNWCTGLVIGTVALYAVNISHGFYVINKKNKEQALITLQSNGLAFSFNF